MKKTLIKLHWLLSSQFGFDPLKLIRSIRALPGFILESLAFRKAYSGPIKWVPCLHDRFQEGGTTKDEYFLQDLTVARWIFDAQPRRHVDVGSRVDGFVAHVASFREIEVFDVRPVSSKIPGMVFRQADLSQPVDLHGGVRSTCDSLSCLHALEHFGLGRYGDVIDPEAHVSGMRNMLALLETGGTFYLSTPVGAERVEFNANRVFDPRTLVALGLENGLRLRRLCIISGGAVRENDTSPEALAALAEQSYRLGLFEFEKTESGN